MDFLSLFFELESDFFFAVSDDVELESDDEPESDDELDDFDSDVDDVLDSDELSFEPDDPRLSVL